MKFNCTKVIAENLSEEEIKGLKQMFNNMDTDRSGTITYEELNSGLSRLGSKLTEVEIKQLMDGVRTMPKLCSFYHFLFCFPFASFKSLSTNKRWSNIHVD